MNSERVCRADLQSELHVTSRTADSDLKKEEEKNAPPSPGGNSSHVNFCRFCTADGLLSRLH